MEEVEERENEENTGRKREGSIERGLKWNDVTVIISGENG
jgi:hypothetical protein